MASNQVNKTSRYESETDPILAAAVFYAEATQLNIASLDDESRRRRTVPDGEVIDVPTDADTVLDLNIDSPFSTSELSRRGRRELGFTLGLMVGAALERDGSLPEGLEEAVQGIVDRSQNG